MNKLITILIFSFSFLFTSQAHAAVPPLQFPSDDFTITGLRASVLYGKHQVCRHRRRLQYDESGLADS